MSFLVQILLEVVARLLFWLVAWPFRLLARLFRLRVLWERGMARNGALFPVYVLGVFGILGGIVAVLIVVLAA